MKCKLCDEQADTQVWIEFEKDTVNSQSCLDHAFDTGKKIIEEYKQGSGEYRATINWAPFEWLYPK